MTALGDRIKALRGERQLQQRQLAEKAGLTPSMVSQIESGRLTPSLHTVGKLAGALGVPIASLFETAPSVIVASLTVSPSMRSATATPRIGKSNDPRRRSLRYVERHPSAGGSTMAVRTSPGCLPRYWMPSSR